MQFLKGIFSGRAGFRTRTIIRASVVLLYGILLCSIDVAFGQSTFGSILGTVQDPSGGALATCKVTINNKGTSSKRSALTDSSGNYVVTNLDPGNYEVSFEASG